MTVVWAILLVLAYDGSSDGTTCPDHEQWPSFRGAGARGVAEDYPLLLHWNVPEGENVRWKTPIPGLGHSSPVVWGERIFLTSSVRTAGDAKLRVGLYGDPGSVDDSSPHQWYLYCLSNRDGRILWERMVHQGVPMVKRHLKSSHANSTPATDGHHVVAFFGSEGLFCYDVCGTLLWKRDLGLLDAGYYRQPANQWAFGSSPIIYENKVLVQCDVQKDSFLAALDLETGKEVWRTSRADVPTWSTPTVLWSAERTQVIVNGFRHIGGYDLWTGKELWKLSVGGDIPVPTPVVGGGFIFITNGHGGMSPIYAIRPTAEGDITLPSGQTSSEYVAWSYRRGGNYLQTPIVYRGKLYCCTNSGILSCYDVASGVQHYRNRLGGGRSGFSASAVAGDGKLYFTGEEGDVYVVGAGTEFEVLGTNPMGENCMATPAIWEGEIYFRTRGHLVAIGLEKRCLPTRVLRTRCLPGSSFRSR